MYDLIAIGNPVYDEIITPEIRFQGRVLSGCSTNACLAAKKLGVNKVGIIGSIGSDMRPHFMEKMKRYGIDVLSVKDAQNTGGFRLIYDEKGDRTLDVLNVAEQLYPEDLPSLEAKNILFAPILQEIDLEFISSIRKTSEASLFLDPQGMIRGIDPHGRIVETCNPQKATALARLVNVIKPNEHEARVITKVENPYTAARLLSEWGADIGIVTLAERGSIVAKGREFIRIPAYKTTAIDPTGAGDTYMGAFIAKFLEEKSLFECAIFASAAASIKVEHSGPDFPMNYHDVNQRMQHLLH